MPEMQSLGVIHLNTWSALISMANLVILFFLLKKFLFKPVRKVLDQRQAHVDGVYAQADEALAKAEADKATWAERMSHAREEADAIVARASENAQRSTDVILSDARFRADGIVRQAEEEARLTQLRAEEGIRQEIAGVSAELAGKLLGREINEQDHRDLIDSFIEEMGESHASDQ